METFVDIISDIGAQISKIKRCRINQQTLNREVHYVGFNTWKPKTSYSRRQAVY